MARFGRLLRKTVMSVYVLLLAAFPISGIMASSASPAEAASSTTVSSLSTGSEHSCAITSTNGIFCWGANYFGQLGDGTTTSSDSPVLVTGLPSGTTVSSLSSGSGQTCALTGSGQVYCWGQQVSQPGTQSSTPVKVTGFPAGTVITQISAGNNFACALDNSGLAYCWGSNANGQLGTGSIGLSDSSPQLVTGFPAGTVITQISAGFSSTCAVTSTGSAYCWGSNIDGLLGTGQSTNSTATPTQVSGMSSGVKEISVGPNSACDVLASGSAYCWGSNANGTLGTGSPGTDEHTPAAVKNLTNVSNISVGGNQTCALTSSGADYCWGLNNYGQIGNGTNNDAFTPAAVNSVPGTVTYVGSGAYNACNLSSNGTVYCWGYGSDGELGNLATNNSNVPVAVVFPVPPAITSSNSANFTYGSSGSFTVTTSGTPVPAISEAGSLPNGLSFTDNGDGTATISGTLASGTEGTYDITFMATNAIGNDSQNFTLNANQASQTVHYTSTAPTSAVYGQTYNVSATGGASGNPVTFSSATTSVCTVSGSTISFVGVGACTVNANQAASTDYSAATEAQQSFNVAKAPQSVTFTSSAPTDAVYNGSSYTVSATGGASGNSVSFSSSTTSVCTVSGSTVSFVGVGTCTIDASQSGDADYESAQAVQTFSVNKAGQTITFTSKASPLTFYEGPRYDVTATGGSSGNPILFSAATPSVCSVVGYIVSFVGVGTCTINANQAGNGDYLAAAQAQQSFNVSKAPQTIHYTSSAPTNAVYNGSGYSVTATGGASGNPVVFSSATPSVCSVSESAVSFVGVGTCTINANQAGNDYYSAAPQNPQSFSVAKAPQTINFISTAPTNAVYGGTYTVSATGGASGNPVTFSSVSTSVCTVSGSMVSFVGVGGCEINATQAGDTYYLSVVALQSFNVAKAPQTITFTSQAPTNAVYNGPAYDVSATGGGSGNQVVFSSATTSVCNVSGSTVSFVGVGTCTVNADQAGNSNYLAAGEVQQSFNVNKAPQTLNFTTQAPTNAVYSGPVYSVAANGGTSGNPVVFFSATTSVCNVSGSNVSFVGVGTCTISADQGGNALYLAATEVQQSFNVAKAPTALRASNASVQLGFLGKSVTFSATLSSATTGSLLSGMNINFSLQSGDGQKSCTATTNTQGVGSCTVNYSFSEFLTPVPSTYQASFNGTTVYMSSLGNGSIGQNSLAVL